MGHPSTSAPTVILADALYPRRGAIISSGVSETRISEAAQQGVRIPWMTVGKRKFIRGADLIWYIEQLAQLETAGASK